MKTVVKSFIGAALGTALILFVTFYFLKPWPDNSQASEIQRPQPPAQTQVVNTSYVVPKNIDFTQAATKSVDAVVHIKTIIGIKPDQYDDFFGTLRDYFYGYPRQRSELIAFGSGVIISPDGYIVTNNHVVAGANKILVTFNDKKEMVAKVIGTSPSTDLALIKVDAKDLPYLTYGNSDELKVGQWVLAVGNPFNLTSTVTAGIVSAKARDIHVLGGQSSIESFIQTDAAVNPGNSGGALVNTDGQLVGINAAIASQTGAYEGYSFAIPVNLVKKVVNDLMKYGEIQRGYMGIQIRDIDARFAKENHLDDLEGVYVAGVIQDGGAAQAGMKPGDIITSLNNQEVKSMAGFMGILGQFSPGNKVMVTVMRGSKTKTLEVTLRNKNGTLGLIRPQKTFYSNILGAELKAASTSEDSKLGISHGIVITRVGDDGIIKKGGISSGFIITEVNSKTVDNQHDLESALKLSKNQNNVVRLRGMYPNGMKISFEFML
ncbi:MAG: trypsin-like peptidase domain-containing protein [Bacteroidales bacterium]|nr:trypsin-like peptidase domain-containing protein [Bacteroidales bacterium]